MSLLVQKASLRTASASRPASRVAPRPRLSVVVRAEEASSSAAASEEPAKYTFNHGPIPALVWEKDTEGIRDVFAFAGSAPERCNGRVAMLAFASLALTEYSKHTPVLEQLGSGVFGAILLSLTLTVATVMPKIVSGSSLKDLHNCATGENLKSEGLGAAMALFDQNLEMWTGRLAMIGVVGLVAADLIKGDSFF